jgi:hypothetical protein
MRKEIIPKLVQVFPKSVEHLSALGIQKQKDFKPESSDWQAPLRILENAAGIHLRRPHWENLSKLIKDQNGKREFELSLPGHWNLRFKFHKNKTSWVLEKNQ